MFTTLLGLAYDLSKTVLSQLKEQISSELCPFLCETRIL